MSGMDLVSSGSGFESAPDSVTSTPVPTESAEHLENCESCG